MNELLAHADAALYFAKASGKNRYHFFNERMNDSVQNYIKLEKHLRYAIENNELELHYQPKIIPKTGEIMGVEALLRWHNAEHGHISPASFIPLAEETGLIIPIGTWVIHTACAQARQWHKQGNPVCVSVNLSGRQFQCIEQKNAYLFNEVVKALEESELPPYLLELEITESIMMHNLSETLKTIKRLKEIGVKISIDDFGTGYSSLSYLKTFPIDTLKIDKSFINNIATNSDDAAIVSAIIAMAKQLQLEVVAEGVETQEQVTILKKQNCHLIQGYYFSKPVVAEEINFDCYEKN